MYEYRGTPKTFIEFTEKMIKAGFTGDCFMEFVRSLPDVQFGKADEGLARKLYLAYIGLADFSLNTKAVVEMYDARYYWSKESDEFREATSSDFRIHKDDRHLFDRKLDLSRLDIMSALFPTEDKITLEEGLRRIAGQNTTIKFASFWHGQWLDRHQEFIPEKWKELLRLGGHIIFPRVRLCAIQSGNYPPIILYPFFRVDIDGYRIKYSQEMEVCDEEKHHEVLRRDKDFFAYFRPVEESTSKKK